MATHNGKKPKMPKIGEESQQREFEKLAVSAGNMRTSDYPATKTSGVKIRGCGAATKGCTARGPMA
jgi:hypothetical protein